MGKFTKKAVSTALSLTVAVFAFGFSIGHRSEAGSALKTKVSSVRGHGTQPGKKKVRKANRLSAVNMPRMQHDGRMEGALNSQGVLAFRAASAPVGLYSLTENCSENQYWEGEQYWVPTTGFRYGDSIYGISALYMYGTMYVDRMDYDIASGEMTFCESMDKNPEHAAISAVYDPNIIDGMEWIDEAIQLPSDARYFALRYCSNSRGCLVMIDDIEFTPAAADAIFTGYDILKNGNVIMENTAVDCSFTDTEGERNSLYRVRPVYTLEGETNRGYLSNEASAADTGIYGMSADKYGVYGEKERIVITGASGQEAGIYSLDGKTIRKVDVINDHEVVRIASGSYVVLIGQRAVKVIVR